MPEALSPPVLEVNTDVTNSVEQTNRKESLRTSPAQGNDLGIEVVETEYKSHKITIPEDKAQNNNSGSPQTGTREVEPAYSNQYDNVVVAPKKVSPRRVCTLKMEDNENDFSTFGKTARDGIDYNPAESNPESEDVSSNHILSFRKEEKGSPQILITPSFQPLSN